MAIPITGSAPAGKAVASADTIPSSAAPIACSDPPTSPEIPSPTARESPSIRRVWRPESRSAPPLGRRAPGAPCTRGGVHRGRDGPTSTGLRAASQTRTLVPSTNHGDRP